MWITGEKLWFWSIHFPTSYVSDEEREHSFPQVFRFKNSGIYSPALNEEHQWIYEDSDGKQLFESKLIF